MSSFLDKILDVLRKNPEAIGVIDDNLLFVLCQYSVNESDSKVKELTCTRLRGKQTCYSTNTSTNENDEEVCEQLRSYTPNSLFVYTIVGKSDTLMFYDGKSLHRLIKVTFLSNNEFILTFPSKSFPEITDQFRDIKSLEEWSQTIYSLRTTN